MSHKHHVDFTLSYLYTQLYEPISFYFYFPYSWLCLASLLTARFSQLWLSLWFYLGLALLTLLLHRVGAYGVVWCSFSELISLIAVHGSLLLSGHGVREGAFHEKLDIPITPLFEFYGLQSLTWAWAFCLVGFWLLSHGLLLCVWSRLNTRDTLSAVWQLFPSWFS